MQTGWRVGTLFGIPLFIDPSWFLILIVVAIANALGWQNAYPEWGIALQWGTGLVMALLLFGSVLLHELGHSLVALKQGIAVNSITLYLFGGVASIDRESKTPGQAFQVAIAGPAVSFSLFILLFLVAGVLPIGSPMQVLTLDLSRINLVLTLFNLLPGLPLDGGQVFKAAVWKITGNRFKGVRWAAMAGRILGWTAIGLGVALIVLRRDYINGLWIAFLGRFAVRNADAYSRSTDLQEALLSLKAVDAMTRDYRVIDAAMTLRQFADNYLLGTVPASIYFAASDGRYRGMISGADLQQVERSQWESKTVNELVHPLAELVTVDEQTPLANLIHLLETHQLGFITVLSPAGAVAGVCDRGDVVRALTQKLKLQVSESTIKQIKEQGVYPPGLPVLALAKATMES